MEITAERFAELIVAEHKYQRLCNVIQDRARAVQNLDWRELQLIVDLLCPIVKAEETEGSEEFPCL
jgi:hypothetical protein